VLYLEIFVFFVQEKGDASLGPNSNGQRFNYLFYVDFVGTLSDVRCQNALRHLQVRMHTRMSVEGSVYLGLVS